MKNSSRPNYMRRRLALLVLLLLPVLIWYGFSYTKESITLQPEAEAPRVQKAEPVYILLMGVDERVNDKGRSDTMILVRLGRDPERVDAVSLPRDTRITLKGKKVKLNAAYYTGGAETATTVVADLLDIPRPYYVKVNLKSFEEIIDQLGGVEMEIDRDYYYEDPYQDLVIDIKAGQQVLDGATALKFVRLRYDGVTNDDIARIQRQQQFIRALQAKFKEPSSWSRIPSLITTMRRNIATNLPTDDQLPLAQALFGARSTLQMSTLPGTPDDATGDWLLDLAKWNEVRESWSPAED